MKLSRAILVVLLAAFALTVTGCGSLPRYQEAQTKYSLSPPERTNLAIVIFLEPVFPGKPFDEVVCDNTIGAMWSPEESRKIGFTQNYSDTASKHAPLLALLATLPASLAVGLAASGQAGDFNISSRIMVPYGRFITSNLTELLAMASPDATVCLDQQCVRSKMQSGENSRLVAVQFTKLRVAENEANTLTLIVEGAATVVISGQPIFAPISHSIVNRSITSEGFFHSDFLRAMNKTANEMASSVAVQIYSVASRNLRGSEQGDPAAALRLGFLLDSGDWFKKACDLGSLPGCHNAGVAHESGKGKLDKDYSQARAYYLRAAERGYMQSQYNLASLYSNNHISPPDDVEGLKWMLLAQKSASECKQDQSCGWALQDPPGHKQRLLSRLSSAQKENAESLAAEWKPKH